MCPAREAQAADDDSLDPVGLWYCLVYGHLGLDNWHVSLRLEPDGRGSLAWGLALGDRQWRALSGWSIDDGVVSFEDPETRQRFEADLERSTLGGTWRADARSGGWWCAPRPALARDSSGLRTSVAAMATPLTARSVKAPDYPRQAVREAKEGRAVVCFLVDRDGFVVEPEIVELSDEVFREPTLQAVSQSRFAPSEEPVPLRPGCRTYTYRLDVIR